MKFRNPKAHFIGIAFLCCVAVQLTSARAQESDPAHRAKDAEAAVAWPKGIIPYDVTRLNERQQQFAIKAMRRWMDTGANICFVPRTNEVEYICFTGATNAGNNTSFIGFKKGQRANINITTFWWGDEWMAVHELGHVLGFFHEHARWDRDRFVTIHYENIKPGRAADYDWIPQTNWLVQTTSYDYRSIMHYRICWASACEKDCRDADGTSPCTVISPVDRKFDKVIGQWGDNGISATDAEKARLAYGVRKRHSN